MTNTATTATTPVPNSFAARATAASLRLLFQPLLSPRFSIRTQRIAVASLRYLLPRPRGVRCEALTLDGFDGYKLTPEHAASGKATAAENASASAKANAGAGAGAGAGISASPNPAILFFHGGGYVVGSPGTHLSLMMRIAKASGQTVYAPRYRLAPEHPYPAQREDAARALTALAARGVPVESLTFAGDSAGAHLALTLALSRKLAGQSLPRALVLISPWADTTLTQLPTPERDSLLSTAWVRQVRDCVFTTPAQHHEPLASPVFADLAGLPPVLIQSAEYELLCKDARRLHAALLQAGVNSVWEEAPGLWHDYQLNAGIVPEAAQAVARIGEFIRKL